MVGKVAIAIAVSMAACVGNPGDTSRSEFAIYGDNTERDDNSGSSDTTREDIVVRVDSTGPGPDPDSGRCSGTLITPTLVLTAAHCTEPSPRTYTVAIGPNDPSWKVVQVVSEASVAKMSTGGSSNDDLAIIKLDAPILAAARSRRPIVWDGWEGDGSFGDSEARFGIAGWSSRSGPQSCTSGEDDPVDDEHLHWRQRAEWMAEGSFFHHYGDDTIETFPDVHNRADKGDSGGPLYHMLFDSGEREVIGVASRESCDFRIDGSYDRNNTYTDVTHGLPADWIRSVALDETRGGGWYQRHAKRPGDYWYGEVDYTGPCTNANNLGGFDRGDAAPSPTQDLDCDHWYDIHDDCPLDYNPEQLEFDDVTGASYACSNRFGVSGFDPGNPTKITTTTEFPGCTTEQPDCPAAAMFYTELHGQFWQNPRPMRDVRTGSWITPRYDAPSFLGSFLRIDPSHPTYQGQAGIAPDFGLGEWYMPPSALPGTIAFRDIGSVSDPTTCTLKLFTISAARKGRSEVVMTPTSSSSSFTVLSGLWGNVGSPDLLESDQSTVRVSNRPGGTTYLSQIRDQNVDYVNFGAEAIMYDCPGSEIRWYRSEVWVNAFGDRPATTELVPAVDANHVACFLTGVGGAWGRSTSRASTQPAAKIYKDGTTGAIMLTVTPIVMPWPDYLGPVRAAAGCIDLLPW